jgi:hypothetical protein
MSKHQPFEHDLLSSSAGASSHGPFESFAEGGVQIVFKHPYFEQLEAESGGLDPGVVFKLNRADLLAHNAGSEEAAKAAIDALAEEQTARWLRMRSYFGESMVTQEVYSQSVWFTAEQVLAVWGDQKPPRPEGDFQAIIVTQDKVPELISGNFLSLTVPYPERRKPPVAVATYVRANDRWLARSADRTPPAKSEVTDMVATQQSPAFEALLDATSKPGPLRLAASQFVANAIRYSNETGEIVDISGQDNVIFTLDGRCRIVDGLYPEAMEIAHELPAIIRKLEALHGLTALETNKLLNGLGYIRVINFLAAYYQLPKRVHLVGESSVSEAVWERSYTRLTKGLRWKQLLQTTQPSTLGGVAISVADLQG